MPKLSPCACHVANVALARPDDVPLIAPGPEPASPHGRMRIVNRCSGSARFRRHHHSPALPWLHKEGAGVVVHVTTVLDGRSRLPARLVVDYQPIPIVPGRQSGICWNSCHAPSARSITGHRRRLPSVRRSSASPGRGHTQPYARSLGRKLLRRATSIRGPSASSSSSPGRGSWCPSRLTQLRASCSHIGDRTAALGENGPPQPLRLVSRLGPALLEAVDQPTDAWGLHPFQVANFPRPTW
jgi:hypothetical protein